MAVTSTDPRILQLFVGWLEKYYNTSRKQLKVRIQVWSDTNVDGALSWWSKTLNIPKTNFIKTNIKKPGKKKTKTKYGVCRVYIDSKDLLFKILNDIDKEFGPPATY